MSTQPSAATLYNTVGDPVPVITDEQGDMRAAPPNGRLVVAAGQIIASAWGNTTYDQTFMTFANAADRTNQWPVPNEGGLSFLMDSRTPWIYRQGAWRGLPLGFMTSASGPASDTAYGAAVTTVASTPSFSVAAGRAYRITAYCFGTITNAQPAGANYRIRYWSTGMGAAADVVFTSMTPSILNAPLVGAGVALLQPTQTGSANAQLMVSAGTNGVVQIAANAGSILVEDIGG